MRIVVAPDPVMPNRRARPRFGDRPTFKKANLLKRLVREARVVARANHGHNQTGAIGVMARTPI
jgi:hypothetical protein